MRLRRAAAILVSIVALPVVAWIVWDAVESSRLTRRLDALFPFIDADPAAPPGDTPRSPATEALRLYREAGRLATPGPTEAPRLRPQDVQQTIDALAALPAREASRDARLGSLRELERSYQQVLESLDRAVALGPLNLDESERSRDIMAERRLIEINAVRVARLAFAGDGDDAVAALTATLRLNDLEPTWYLAYSPFNPMHGLQLTLSFGSPSPAALEHLQREYEMQLGDRDLENYLVLARYQLARFAAPEEFETRPQRMSLGTAALARLARPYRNHGLNGELDRYEDALAAVRQPWPARLDAAASLTAKFGVWDPPGTRDRASFVMMLAPFRGAAVNELANVMPRAAEGQARTRVALTAIAVERYRRVHAGALPASLAQLAPDFSRVPLADPFTGEALQYRQASGGYRIYSLGSNRQDDGGAWDPPSDFGRARRGDPKDVGMTVELR
jgi:hypothetical protein